MILIATGSEVALCVQAKDVLEHDHGIMARVVSMPSWDLFEAQDSSYKESVLPKRIKSRVTVEAGASFGWRRWAGDDGEIIAVDRFGASAPGEEVLRHLGFTVENVVSTALRVTSRISTYSSAASVL